MNGFSSASRMEPTDPSIMEGLDSLSFFHSDIYHCNNDATPVKDFNASGLQANIKRGRTKSFLLLDGKENLKVSGKEEFVEKLCCGEKGLKVKVVSIFGNTGDGKSHTLNHTFFKGREVFKTSNEQSSCTLGVWAAFTPRRNVICLDTEGLLGITTYENERTRLLLKVLAISDIVIYGTRSERLNRDLFTFLGTASRAYTHYFHTALQAVGQREGVNGSTRALGPSVIVLHETRHTRPLTNNGTESAEDILRTRFAEMRLETEAFSSMKYVGLQTVNAATDYKPLEVAIRNELNNTTVRSARHPHHVYNTLKILNDKFSGDIENFSSILFPNQYFTCPMKCLSCGCRCTSSMGHLREGKPHTGNTRCRYQHQYENLEHICKKCYGKGDIVPVTRIQTPYDNSWYGFVQYAWSGEVIECPHCGEIYRSRQYWYGNKNPEEAVIRTEITHVWNTINNSLTSQNTAQRVIDGVSYITEAVTNVSLQPTKVLSAWVADQIAPSYWRPNNEIKHCQKCKFVFGPTDTKHHCRACGEGFCASCSSNKSTVPSRNWFSPVRICDLCYNKDTTNANEELSESYEDVSARKVSEQFVSTLSAVGTVLNYSKAIIKDTARPSYWIPDSEVISCCICDYEFSPNLPLHHCRDCGQGVCQNCSQNRKPVFHRGWDKPVRVCDSCIKID